VFVSAYSQRSCPLVAEIVDIHINHIGIGVKVNIPYIDCYIVPLTLPVSVAQQVFEQLELFRRKGLSFFRPGSLPYYQGSSAGRRLSAGCRWVSADSWYAAAVRESSSAVPELKWFDDIVIGAGIVAFNLFSSELSAVSMITGIDGSVARICLQRS
jgi:hypothetical protein